MIPNIRENYLANGYLQRSIKPVAVASSCRVNNIARDTVEFSCKSVPGVMVSFGRIKETDIYPQEDIEKIQELVNRCHYQKNLEALLKKGSGFDVRISDGGKGLNLVKFNYPLDDSKPLKGVCNELALKIGVMLSKSKDLGDKYSFAMVEGTSSRFFREDYNHYYLLAWPKDQHERYRATLDWEIMAETERLPKGFLVIDPSFQTVMLSEKAKGYKLQNFVKDLSNAPESYIHKKPSDIPLSFSPIEDKTLEIPLGYYNDFDDSANASKIRGNPIIVMSFIKKQLPKSRSRTLSSILPFKHTRKERSIDVELEYLQDGKSAATHSFNWKGWIRSLPEDNSLKQFIKFINKRLDEQSV